MQLLEEKKRAFERLLIILEELRCKCPWDMKQTMNTLRNLTIEETYELTDAISNNDLVGVKEELGDLILHILFYAKIAEEEGAFTIEDVLNKQCEKLIHRHPHIYGSVTVKDEQEVKKNWEQLKLKEGKKSVLEGVPKSLPAVIKAFRIQEKAAQVNFEFEHAQQVWAKVEEEIKEFKDIAFSTPINRDQLEDEFGDILFSLINFSRFMQIDPEHALEKTNKKFITRFQYIEKHATQQGININEMTLEQMDLLWNEAKNA